MRNASAGLPDDEWDAEVLEHGGHFLQTTPWLRVQEARGAEVMWQRGEGWRWAAALHRGRGVRYLYCAYGPCVDSPQQTPAAVRAVSAAARLHNLDFSRVEPDIPDGSCPIPGRPSGGGQPRHSLLLDLRRGEEALRADLTSGRRRSINTAGKRGVSIRRSRDPADAEIFIELIHRTADRNQFHPHPDSYYRTVCRVLFPLHSASLYVAEVESDPVAAVIALESATTSYYTYAAADAARSRKLVAAAPLVWRMVCDAVEEQRSTFDFWGVLADDGVDHPWAGFSQFKKTFGGSLISRPGTFDIPVRRLRYLLYASARGLLRRGAIGQ